MPIGRWSPSAKTVQLVGLAVVVGVFEDQHLIVGLLPGKYIGYEGMVLTHSRPLASNVMETGSSRSGNSTSEANRLIA